MFTFRNWVYSLGLAVVLSPLALAADEKPAIKPADNLRAAPIATPGIGLVLPPFAQNALKLTEAQKKELEALQKDVDDKLNKILTEDQKKQLEGLKKPIGKPIQRPEKPGEKKPEIKKPAGVQLNADEKKPAPGAQDRPLPIRPGMGAIGQILPAGIVNQLKLTEDQKKQLEALQKDADDKLNKILTEDQKKQLEQMKKGGFNIKPIPAPGVKPVPAPAPAVLPAKPAK